MTEKNLDELGHIRKETGSQALSRVLTDLIHTLGRGIYQYIPRNS